MLKVILGLASKVWQADLRIHLVKDAVVNSGNLTRNSKDTLMSRCLSRSWFVKSDVAACAFSEAMPSFRLRFKL